jgi:tRNA G10  N-methylase Trm11
MIRSLEPQSLCVLGRQPALGLAELESLYKPAHVLPFGEAALLDVDFEQIEFSRLGGAIKVAKVLAELPSSRWESIEKYLVTAVPEHAKQLPDGKLTLGLSLYGLSVAVPEINKSLLKIKAQIKKSGRPIRIVPNKSAELSSAQVLHNQLTHRGGWELLVVVHGSRAILAQTMFVQDIEAYAARDQARPARDARVGMLPPKLAQIMINLAVGQLEIEPSAPKSKIRLLDSFCGTGVVLQEAMLMGYSVIGTDLEPRMVEYSKTNLAWLVKKHPGINAFADVEVGNATNYQWPPFSALVSETYLGRPLNSLPAPDKLQEIIRDVNTILEKFLKNLAKQIKPDRPICLAVPTWRKPDGTLIPLPLIDGFDRAKLRSPSILSPVERIDRLSVLGYNYVDFEHVGRSDLCYFRESQTVARQLLVLRKS